MFIFASEDCTVKHITVMVCTVGHTTGAGGVGEVCSIDITNFMRFQCCSILKPESFLSQSANNHISGFSHIQVCARMFAWETQWRKVSIVPAPF